MHVKYRQRSILIPGKELLTKMSTGKHPLTDGKKRNFVLAVVKDYVVHQMDTRLWSMPMGKQKTVQHVHDLHRTIVNNHPVDQDMWYYNANQVFARVVKLFAEYSLFNAETGQTRLPTGLQITWAGKDDHWLKLTWRIPVMDGKPGSVEEYLAATTQALVNKNTSYSTVWARLSEIPLFQLMDEKVIWEQTLTKLMKKVYP